LAERRAGRRVGSIHLVIPAPDQAVAQRIDLERGDQRTEVIRRARLAVCDLARPEHLAPARVEQPRRAPELLAGLEVLDDLAAGVDDLAARPARLDHPRLGDDTLRANGDVPAPAE